MKKMMKNKKGDEKKTEKSIFESIVKKSALAIVVLSFFALSSCINYSSTTSEYNKGYGFFALKVHPIADNNVIYISSLHDKATLLVEAESQMFMPAENVRIVAENYNNDSIGLDTFNSLTVGGVHFEGYTKDTGFKDMQYFEATFNVRTVRNQPYSTNLKYYVCADARTYHEGTICLKPEGQRGTYTETCVPGRENIPSGQGAPVAITTIEHFDAGRNITFFIKAVNMGKGLVYDKGTSPECSVIRQENVGLITMDSFFIGDTRISCENMKERMGFDLQYQKNAGATFKCSASKESLGLSGLDSTVRRPVTIQLSYGYNQLMASHNILIRNSPGYSYSAEEYQRALEGSMG